MTSIFGEIKTNILKGEKELKEERLLELISSSFTDDKFYLRDSKTTQELIELINSINPLFIVKASIFSRKFLNIKTIIYFIASKLATRISGEIWAKDYYFSIILTLGDMIAILDLLLENNQKISNSIKKGFAKGFNKFDDKHISLYLNRDNILKLKRLLKIIHPKSLKRNEKSLKNIMDGNIVLPELNIKDIDINDYISKEWYKLLCEDQNLILDIIRKGSI